MNRKVGKPPFKEDMLTDDAPLTLDRLTVEGLQFDKAHIKEKTITLSSFRDVGFKGAAFEDCTFSHNRFENCYFRKASFARVSFVGSSFKDCRFDEAQFSECHLDYAEFQNCSITYKQIAHTLPRTDNVLRALARTLRVNSQDRGQTDDCREFLLAETRATENHNFKKAFERRDTFYRVKYSGWERWVGFFTWLWLRFNWYFWGHGEAPFRIILSAAIVVLGFAGAFWLLRADIVNLPSDHMWVELLGFSTASFVTTTYGNLAPNTVSARWVVAGEGAIGLTMFGFLVAALYRRVSRR